MTDKRAMETADELVGWIDSVKVRKHDCPGFDCATCSLHLMSDTDEMAAIIHAAYAPLVEQRDKLVEALLKLGSWFPLLHDRNCAIAPIHECSCIVAKQYREAESILKLVSE